jgi:hypothetical protein
MINILRKNQKALWGVIAVLCIPFVFYFSKSDMSRVENTEFGKIYGRSIPIIEYQHNMRLFNLARELGMFTYLQDLVTGARTEHEAYAEFTMNRLILQHEAQRLGIRPSIAQIAAAVKEFRPFRGATGFDSAKFNEFTQQALPALGFTERQIEELAADQLSLARIKELIAAGVQIPEAESKENYERAYGKMEVAVVRFNSADFEKSLQIADDDIAKYYEAHKAELNTDEKRKVSFVTFGLNEDQKKLTGKERVEVLQKLADNANDFNQALLEKGADFDQVAAKFQRPVQTTGDFTKAAPDPALKGNAQLAAAAFQLTAQEPNSDVVQAGDEFYILHLGGIEAARPLTLEEAKPKIVEALKTQSLRQIVSTKGAEAAQKIREAMKSGATAEAAIQQAGYTVEKVPPFALADPATPPKAEADQPAPPQTADIGTIKSTVAEMSAGEVSDLVPMPTGGFIAVVEKRDKPDMAGYESGKKAFNERFLSGKREVAFYEWLRARRDEAGIQSRSEEPPIG